MPDREHRGHPRFSHATARNLKRSRDECDKEAHFALTVDISCPPVRDRFFHPLHPLKQRSVIGMGETNNAVTYCFGDSDRDHCRARHLDILGAAPALSISDLPILLGIGLLLSLC